MSNLKLREVREDCKLTQKEFAESIGLKQAKVRDIENNKAKVTVEIAIAIEDKFKINSRWLLTGRGDKYIKDISSNINVNNSNNVAVNGTICINTKDYVDSAEIKELLELLKDVPKSWVKNMIDKLKKSLNAIDNDFKE